ncbi:hypothetical protein AVEN_259563-1 [Araneus ventricosus]|uniref:Uncharacterized protein n=1 Tax=Araneus ventricosus TaxID=182803 RepID=A0A4Y2EN26_ARAVE|nr:hypothetical protein AVEN_259563-1 [Araneus ventricosus]
MRNVCTKFNQNRQAYRLPISNMYFGDFPALPRKLGIRLIYPYQYFKSYSEEHVYEVSSKLPIMSIGLFDICILDTLPHTTLREWITAYLPLQYFKSANEEPVNQASSELD